MAERTTRRQVELMVGEVMRLADRAGVDVTGWRVENAPLYGGWNLQRPVGGGGGVTVLGGAMMDGNRMRPADFYRAMRILRDVLELVPDGRVAA